MTTALPSADHRSGEGHPSDTANGLATSELAIGGMHCASSAQRVQRSLRAVPAVASVAVNLGTERAYVTFDPAVSSTDELCEAVAAGGYSAEPAPEELSVADEAIDRDGWRWRAVAVVAAGARRALRRPVRARGRSQRLDRPAVGRRRRDRRRVAVPPVERPPAASRCDQHGHADHAGHAGRPGGECCGGDRPRRPAPPPRRERRLRGSAPRRHGAADHRHPRDRPCDRGAGAARERPGPSTRCSPCGPRRRAWSQGAGEAGRT